MLLFQNFGFLLFLEVRLFLLLLLILVIGRLLRIFRFEVHLFWNTLSLLRPCLEDLICEQSLVDGFIVRSWAREHVIVHVTSLGWVNADVVATSLVLSTRFANVLTVFAVEGALHRLDKIGHLTRGALLLKPIERLIQLHVDLGLVLALLVQTRALNPG